MKTNTTIVNFITFIYSVLKRPGMYQVNRVEDISLVILGYTTSQFAIKDESIANFMNEFREFVTHHFASEKDFGWEKLIRFYASGDLGSINLFAQLFDQFIKAKQTLAG